MILQDVRVFIYILERFLPYFKLLTQLRSFIVESASFCRVVRLLGIISARIASS